MDPLAVLRTVWRQRWFALPAVIIAVAAAVFVYLNGPRTYDSTQSFALANPKVPSEKEIDADPSLLELNSDNPYLRSSDPNLVANVVITRLNSQETGDRLDDLGLSTDYVVTSGALGGGLVVSISAAGDSPQASLQAVNELGQLMMTYLHEVQTVNGADERYLFTAITVSAPSKPVEQLSSRLRTVVVVGIAGVALVFGAVSLGTWIDNVRAKRAIRNARDHNDTGKEEPDASATPPGRPRHVRYKPLDARVIVQSDRHGR
ncbi:MAG: chain-length determining protein [Microbacterium sp.]|uniref:chain-length determining protein n=1 Tax=Microbacterium sp. TaxID=51671 RepID=UPI00262BF588|nr:chain-length determining protein [Microbacterium sp.]MCX6502860.1 chain-length determining protein [Microbacterium sp.]